MESEREDIYVDGVRCCEILGCGVCGVASRAVGVAAVFERATANRCLLSPAYATMLASSGSGAAFSAISFAPPFLLLRLLSATRATANCLLLTRASAGFVAASSAISRELPLPLLPCASLVPSSLLPLVAPRSSESSQPLLSL